MKPIVLITLMSCKVRKHYLTYAPNNDTNQTPHQHSHNLGPVVQSLVSLTSLLMVKMLTVLVSTISNSQYFC